eukprot:495041-Pyramimonas_sp.AAC.1
MVVLKRSPRRATRFPCNDCTDRSPRSSRAKRCHLRATAPSDAHASGMRLIRMISMRTGRREIRRRRSMILATGI